MLQVVQTLEEGKPLPSSKKSVNVRLDDDEFEAITELAIKYGKSRSEIVRTAMQGLFEVSPAGALNPEQYQALVQDIASVKGGIGKLESQLLRVGNNVNQVARKVNSGDVQALSTLNSFRSDLKLVNDALERLAREVGDSWQL